MQKTFASPEEAVKALIDAVKAGNKEELNGHLWSRWERSPLLWRCGGGQGSQGAVS